jgi:hypothetical protein
MVNSAIRNSDGGKGPEMKLKAICIDLAKDVFGVRGVDERGKALGGVLRYDSKSSTVIVSADATWSPTCWRGLTRATADRQATLQPRAKSGGVSLHSILPPLTDDD